jgi:hypothetical protein
MKCIKIINVSLFYLNEFLKIYLDIKPSFNFLCIRLNLLGANNDIGISDGTGIFKFESHQNIAQRKNLIISLTDDPG